MAYQYLTAKNWGKGFITTDDSSSFGPKGFPGDVWQVPANNRKANSWIREVLGETKTRDEAQAIVDAEVQAAQAQWDAIPEERKNQPGSGFRPQDITLPE